MDRLALSSTLAGPACLARHEPFDPDLAMAVSPPPDLSSGAADSPAVLRVLFVEDDEHLREVLGALFEHDERELAVCASAEEALARLAEGPWDVLVADVNLGGRLSGLDLARRVLDDTPRAWVVLTSGQAIGPQALAALGPRARALPKPFDASELERLLDEARASR